MTVSTTPTKYDPKVLFQGALGTTLTTTLVTAPANRGARVTTFIVIVNAAPGSTSRLVTFDYFKATTGRKICNAMTIVADGAPVNILGMCGGSLILDSGDLIRGGQGTGTDVDCLIMGIEMDG